MKENRFQANLVKELKSIFDGCVIFKNDATRQQGIPDLTILYKNKWAMLECKKDSSSSKRPNQDYYIDKYNAMSFARFINPSNKEEVINELRKTFEA